MPLFKKEEIAIDSENQKRIEQFNATKKIGLWFCVDEEKKQWVIPDGLLTGKIKKAHIYDYSDVVDFELLEDGNSVVKGGLGQAIVGGALFGGVGAIVGGITGKKKSQDICSKMQIKITLNDINHPVEYVNLILTKTKKDGKMYKDMCTNAQEILSILQLMCNQNTNENSNNVSVVDHIKKFKELLDMGAITQEEFDKKKQELLK